MDKAPVYIAGDYGLIFCFFFFYFCDSLEFVLSVVKKEKVFLDILCCCLVRNKHLRFWCSGTLLGKLWLWTFCSKKKNLKIIQVTSAQTSTEETRQTKEPKQYDSHSTPGDWWKIRRFFFSPWCGYCAPLIIPFRTTSPHSPWQLPNKP